METEVINWDEAKLSSEWVDKLTMECMFDDTPKEIVMSLGIKVEGITATFFFDPDKIQKMSPVIEKLLMELPEDFRNGGASFLAACFTKTGEQWTGLHHNMEMLFCLGIASGDARWMLPRTYWEAFPGGMPIVEVGKLSAELAEIEPIPLVEFEFDLST